MVAGATATGKTALAMALAREIAGAEIISADSRQVYRGMDIATAKPTDDERAAVLHHGLDLVDPDEPFTAADFQRAATAALRAISSRGGIAMLVGGTGLYLRAIGRGLPLDQGGIDPEVRSALEDRLQAEGLAPLAAELMVLDPVAAGRLDLHNPRRVIRALERATVTGSASPPAPRGYPSPQRWLGLAAEPVDHRERIDARVRDHFGHGLLEEADRLRGRYPEDLPAFSAMGYREAFDVLAGRCDIEMAMATDAARTWAYARRQRTWFRSEPAIEWLPAGEAATDAARTTLDSFLRESRRAVYAAQE